MYYLLQNPVWYVDHNNSAVLVLEDDQDKAHKNMYGAPV